MGASMVSQGSPPIFVELFAGKGAFSKAALQAGLRVVSVDHEVAQPFAPIVALDLTSTSGTRILWDILSAPGIAAIHLGLPCGTSSRARELPIPLAMKQAGVPEPPPLRSAQFPLGVPGLSERHQRRVDSANALYRLAVEIILWCYLHGVVISIENPANSWLWAALVALAREHSQQAAEALNALTKVLFHACCHGSTRRKNTGWLSTQGVFDALSATCQNDHPHEAWSVKWQSGSWVFDTSTEAQYPHLLAQRAVQCLVSYLAAKGFSISKPLRLHDKSTAVQGKQTKKHRPLIPEYHHVVTLKACDPAPMNSKLLPPHFQGGDVAEEDKKTAVDQMNDTAKYGVYHTPQQFVSMAKTVQHPMDSTDHLENVTKEALNFIFRYPSHVVKLERKKNLLHARLLVAKLAEQEKVLHSSLPTSLQKVLQGKNLLAWKALLEKYEYDDMEVVTFMTEGVKLVGMHDTPPCYPAMLKPATLIQEDLESSSFWRRKAAVSRSCKTDPAHVEHLEQTATEELSMGFMEGPFHSEDEVTAHLGRSDWCAVRRFVLVQGAELKLRPIDDCLEAQLNQAYTVTSYLKLQDIDYIAGLILRIAEHLASGKPGPGVEPWVGKCLDLSKAYKQMGIHPSHRHLSVIFYHSSGGQVKYFVANSLMFGASAAVYSFNRVSRSLWFLLNKMLAIPCGVFYDDYPMFQPSSLASDADESASALLDLLGWRHAKTGSKGLPFSSVFNVLGCRLDLTLLTQGAVVLENKPGRIDRLLDLLEQIRKDGVLSKHQGQIIHGLMRYACGFFSGKFLHQVCAEVLTLSLTPGKSPADVSSFCDYAKSMLQAAKPRKLQCGMEQRPILIFTDGCWEKSFAGIGAIVIDTADGSRAVCSGVVPPQILDVWRQLVGEYIICQIELYVLVLVRWQFSRLLHNRRTLWWIDNDSARFCAIKGLSPSRAMRDLIREFYALDAEWPTFSWIERVPSLSNLSDGPSRHSCEEALRLLGLDRVTPFEHPEELLQRLMAGLSVKRG